MKLAKLNMLSIPKELNEGLAELLRAENICEGSDALIVSAKKGNKLTVSVDKGVCEIEYAEKVQFFRAISYLSNTCEKLLIEQAPCFKRNGVMLDCSRNAVLKIETIKLIIRKMALMGLNTLMLYTEDTYEIEGRPYFGYLRGRYTHEEIKELDNYAFSFGIECLPCIQTLAHLERALQWPQIEKEIRDTDDILMVGEEKTYAFIEDMITAAAAPYRSKRIHIGMDEAWSLGLGNYRFKNGIEPSHKIMKKHLDRVYEILQKHGLEPMMWSDMYLRSASPNGEYYNAPKNIPTEIVNSAHKDIPLVYWDYYHGKTADYDKQLRIHSQFPCKTIFAGGIWTWCGPAPAYDKTFKTTCAALKACKKAEISEVFATCWGDNGAEANLLGILLGLQLYAEYSYTGTDNRKALYERFTQCTGENADNFIALSKFNTVSGMNIEGDGPVDSAKFLLYEDPLMPLFYKDTDGLPLAAHYKSLAAKYARIKTDNPLMRHYYVFYKELAKTITMKCTWRDEATECVVRKNLEKALQLSAYAQSCVKQVKKLKAAWQTLWFATNKPFGLEVIDQRLGGLASRYETAAVQMKLFSEGAIEDIETLSCEKHRYLTTDEGVFRGCFNWARAISACKI